MVFRGILQLQSAILKLCRLGLGLYPTFFQHDTAHDVFSILVSGKVGDSPNHASFAQDVPAMFTVHCIAFRYTSFIDICRNGHSM